MMRTGETSVALRSRVAIAGQRAMRPRYVPSVLHRAASRQRRVSTTAPTLIVPSCSGMYQNQPSAKAAERMWFASSPGSRSAPRK